MGARLLAQWLTAPSRSREVIAQRQAVVGYFADRPALRARLSALLAQYPWLLVEVTPLLELTPNLFLNLLDHSVLGQLVLQWSLHQDWQLLAAVSAPFGSKGTEYGGLETGVEDLTLEAGPSLYAELAWYF